MGKARQKILDASAHLFYTRGIAATGIDAIIADAGVAKQSLYNNFSSKEELESAYIEVRHQQWLQLFNERLTRPDSEAPREPWAEALCTVLAVFDAYADHAVSGWSQGFRGCGLLNAAAELATGSPGRQAVRRHKEEVEAILVKALRPQLEDRAATLGRQLSFLLEGAIARAGLEEDPALLDEARQQAIKLLEAEA